MELSRIEKLLEKYFEGETTISEEKELKVYFTRETVPAHLESYKSMFLYFSEESDIKATRDFDATHHGTSFRPYAWIVAAVSVVIVAGLFFMNEPSVNTSELGTFEDPEVALHETKKILSMVSEVMNEGKKDLVYLNELENAKKDLVYLNEFQNTTSKWIK